MNEPPSAPLAVAALAVLALAAPACAAGGPMAYDTDFCLARDYPADHLRAHPDQTVAAISVMARAGWNVHGGRDLPYMDPTVALTVATRGGPPRTLLLACTDYDEDRAEPERAPGAYYCVSPCGRGMLRITVAGDRATLRSFGFAAQCGLPSLDGAGDRVFALAAAPMRACPDARGLPDSEAAVERWRAEARRRFGID